MKSFKLVLMAILVATLFSCEAEEEDEMCQFDERYPDVTDVQFDINGQSYYQNVTSQSYNTGEAIPDLAKIVVSNSEVGEAISNFDLYFTHVALDEDSPECDTFWQHRLFINANIEQGPNETRVYKVDGNPNNTHHVFANYVFESSAPVAMSSDSTNTLTITQFIPQNILVGSFNITFQDGTESQGSFNLNLNGY